MGVFQHKGSSVEVRMSCNLSPVDKTAIVIVDQVEVVALTRIVSYPEVPDEIIFRVDILYQEIGR